MFAKSVSQLLESPRVQTAVFHFRGVFIVCGLALLVMGATWLLEYTANPELTKVASGHPGEAGSLIEGAAASTPVRSVAEPSAPSEDTRYENSRYENTRYHALSEFLAKRYKVSRAMTLDLVTIAHSTGQQIGLDPLLIIAVMAVESRFNPIAESVAGAKGLMQVIPKYHTDKFREYGGVKTVFDPETNIQVGSQILKEYLKRTGNLDMALQLYGGVSSDEDRVYFGKVMNEKQRLQQVLRKPAKRPEVKAATEGEAIVLASAN